MLATWHIRSEKGALRAIYWSHSACRREAAQVESESMHVYFMLWSLSFSLQRRSLCSLFSSLIRQRIALFFHALHDGIVRWMKPRSTSSSAWNDRRPCQREVRTACRKRIVTAATHHPTSASQAACLQEDRSVPPGASGEDGSDLETGALHCPAGDLASLASGTLPLVTGSTNRRRSSRKPKLSPETISLIKEMAANNRFWGAERIRGELLKLGIRRSQTDHPEVYAAGSPKTSPWTELENVPAQSCSGSVGACDSLAGS